MGSPAVGLVPNGSRAFVLMNVPEPPGGRRVMYVFWRGGDFFFFFFFF